jgi:long-chain acyl-CoA synthetase
MAHIFTLIGCVWTPLLYGMTTVLANTVNPKRLFAMVEHYRIDFLTMVPELLRFLSRVIPRNADLSSLDIVASGGSVLSAEEFERVRERFGAELLHGYGLTEFTPVSCNRRGAARPGTVGTVGAGVECRIAEDGEIMVHSSTMAQGYHGMPQETREAFPEGWLATGDYGRFDGDYLVFEREKKRTCKVNGTMVDLVEVERAVEYVLPDAACRTELREKGLAAVIAIAPGTVPPEPRRVKTRLGELMASHKVPKIIEIQEGDHVVESSE